MQPITYPVLTLLMGIPIFLFIVHRIHQKGFPDGWWMPWMCVMLLVPFYVWMAVGSLRMDVRTMAALAIVVGFLLQPWQSGPRIRWIWADAWVIGMIASQTLTEFSTETLNTLAPLEQLRDFGLPYLLGRLCLRHPQDLAKMLPAVIVPVIILSCYALVESVTQVNIVSRLIGKRWELLESAEGFRWGLKRAQGGLNHPIYLGLMIVLILPWLLEAYHRAKAGFGPDWWTYVPFLATAAMVGTVSRAAQLATLFTIAADFIFRHPRSRGALLTVALVAGIVGYAFRDDILDVLSQFAGEQKNETVKINGVEEPYTGTLHRELLQKVYKESLEKVPILGYGTALDGMPVDSERDERFKSIDDHYLLYHLKYGPFGMVFFIGFSVCIGIYLLREAWLPDTPYAGFCGALFGAFVGTTLLVKGVAMEADFCWVWLFVAGVAGRLRAFRHERDEGNIPQPAI